MALYKFRIIIIIITDRSYMPTYSVMVLY